jgi:acyl carrier protein
MKEVVCKRIHKSKITDLSDSINKTSIQSTSKIEIINTELDDLDQMLFYIEGLLKRTNGSEKIFLDKNFIDQGLESMQLINLVRIIEKDFNIKLFPTILFEYPDPQSFAEYLITEFQSEFYESVHYNVSHSIESDNKKENSSEGNQTIVKNNDELSKLEIKNDDTGRLAIIGMSGRFPGGNTIPEFWERIKNNESLISEIPADRWDWREYYNEGAHIAEHTVCKWGGYIDNATHFDNDFFSIGENEAKMMDPQLRQLLEVVHECAEDSGKILHLKGSNTGVFTGVCFHDYYDVMNRQKIQTNEYTGTGNAATILSNQISNFFDLKGPSLTIDTACSSSLIGLHVALQSIQFSIDNFYFAR